MNSLFRFILFALLMVHLAACNLNPQTQPARDELYSPYITEYPNVPDGATPYGNRNVYDQPNDRNGIINQRAPETPNRNSNSQEIANRLVDLATRVDQVNDATAVVVGRYAVVGIDIDAKLDRSKVGSIKYSVAEALKADPRGAYAIVTADPDTNYRLREMAQEIREGRPVAGIMEELADIVGRLMPQVPRVINEPEDRDGTPGSPRNQERRNEIGQ